MEVLGNLGETPKSSTSCYVNPTVPRAKSAASKESHPGRVGVQANLMVTRSVGSEGEAAL